MWETWVWSLGWRSSKEGKGYPLQCSGPESSMDCVVHGVTKSQTQLSAFHTGGSVGKGSACNARDLASVPGLGRPPGEGNGNPLQYSCLGNPMDRGAWWAAVHGVTKSWTRLSDWYFHFISYSQLHSLTRTLIWSQLQNLTTSASH